MPVRLSSITLTLLALGLIGCGPSRSDVQPEPRPLGKAIQTY